MNLFKNILLLVVRFYKVCLSPFITPCCRFVPTCSSYTEEALRQKGALQGARLSVKRILKCHPFHRGGFDPVA